MIIWSFKAEGKTAREGDEHKGVIPIDTHGWVIPGTSPHLGGVICIDGFKTRTVTGMILSRTISTCTSSSRSYYQPPRRRKVFNAEVLEVYKPVKKYTKGRLYLTRIFLDNLAAAEVYKYRAVPNSQAHALEGQRLLNRPHCKGIMEVGWYPANIGIPLYKNADRTVKMTAKELARAPKSRKPTVARIIAD